MTDALKTIYSSNVVSQKAYDTVELFHPYFSETFYFIADSNPRDLRLEDGTTHTFQPFGFTIQKPATGAKQTDMAFSFSNVLKLGSVELENASEDLTTAITFTYRVYADGSDTPQTDPIVLELTEVNATPTTVTGTASRTNLYGRKIPSRVFEPWVFKGLVQ